MCLSVQLEHVYNVMKFLQLLCEDHFSEAQLYMSTQPNNVHDVDLVGKVWQAHHASVSSHPRVSVCACSGIPVRASLCAFVCELRHLCCIFLPF